ncbi:MAG TPA: hypothetical protein VNU97_02850 [Rhizomicrobium sp.]|jgi:hypothetical protein|nr:hypothetical protein [Rhizomicrobium sp.]
MQSYSYEFFASHVKEIFSLSLGDSSVDMTLTDARRRPPRVVAGLRSEPFTLYFKCQSPVLLPQKIYPFKNAGTGTVGIFIVPVARERDGILYEAVFN